MNYVCHPCWKKANRQLRHDSLREEIGQSSDYMNQEDSLILNVPVRPALPPPPTVILPAWNSSQIMLPNYKRASNTSARCIFNRCNNRAVFLIPHYIKRILLNDQNFYVP